MSAVQLKKTHTHKKEANWTSKTPVSWGFSVRPQNWPNLTSDLMISKRWEKNCAQDLSLCFPVCGQIKNSTVKIHWIRHYGVKVWLASNWTPVIITYIATRAVLADRYMCPLYISCGDSSVEYLSVSQNRMDLSNRSNFHVPWEDLIVMKKKS